MRDTHTSRILLPNRAKVSGKDERGTKFYRAKRRKRLSVAVKGGVSCVGIYIGRRRGRFANKTYGGAFRLQGGGDKKMNKKLKRIALRITKYKLYLYLKANNGAAGAITNIRREKN